MTSSKPAPHRAVPPPTGSANRPASSYARFIPREELQDFAAWQPETFGGFNANGPLSAGPGGPGSSSGPGSLHEPGAQAAEPSPPPEPVPEPPSAEAIAEALAAEWAVKVQEARLQGWQDGHRDGLETLEAAKRQFAQQATAQMAQLGSSFAEQLEALESRMADALVQTAVLLARQVVRSELAQRPDCIAQVARDAINAVMLSARHLRLRLHPEDLPLVAEGAGEALASRDVQLLSDSTIERGGCIVESDLGLVDARIETRWAHAAAVFDVAQSWEAPEPGAAQPLAEPFAQPPTEPAPPSPDAELPTLAEEPQP